MKAKPNNFTKELTDEINRQNKICRNSKLFILNKKLTEFKMPIINKDHLPLQSNIGTTYLIKNNSIVEFYNHYSIEHAYLLSNQFTTLYRSIVTIHNMNLSDIGEFTNATAFIGMDELISHDSEKTLNFMIALAKNGFKIYI